MSVVAFGEMLLRFSPPAPELPFQSRAFHCWLAGAEANVATQLATLGHDVRFASAVPANALGAGAIGMLRAHGVDTGAVRRFGERMGLYFVTSGAGPRPSEVIYDRRHSAFADAPEDAWDWDEILAGCRWLHLSGVTAALGRNGERALRRCLDAAIGKGLFISFDCNFRRQLWERSGREPAPILRDLLASADLMFGNHRDISLVSGMPFDGEGPERRREAAEKAFEMFPRLQFVASTARHVLEAGTHLLSARLDGREAGVQTRDVTIGGIVDRIGSGDAFCAGILHGLIKGLSLREVADTGLALAVLKHSVPGDAASFSQADIDLHLEGASDVRR